MEENIDLSSLDIIVQKKAAENQILKEEILLDVSNILSLDEEYLHYKEQENEER